MKHLVIIPTTKINYEFGFSAPLAWMFSDHVDQVEGIYGFQLTESHVRQYDSFIIELNWFLSYHEVALIMAFIKRRKPNARILIGGLYASLAHPQVFQETQVDYFIKGDNEGPIKQYLNGKDPREIPNFVGRDFENPTSYRFTMDDFHNLTFNLDWFPAYFELTQSTEKKDIRNFPLPMIITAKGGCLAVHEGCDYCMGAHHGALFEIYRRSPLTMDSAALGHALRNVSSRYKAYSVYVLSPNLKFEFGSEAFPGVAHIEIDCPVSKEDLSRFLDAFERCGVLVPLYREGIMGRRTADVKGLLELEDENHKVFFQGYSRDQNLLQELDIPEEKVLFNLDAIFRPEWAHWDAYTNHDFVCSNSRTIYNWMKKRGHPVFVS